MLGYIVAEGRGKADTLIRDVALNLQAQGLAMAGAVQVNIETDPARKCQMDLHILSGDAVVRISQDLGLLSRGCRLDPNGLEGAVGWVGAALTQGARLLVVNKFGKQERDGQGFRDVLVKALDQDGPVLLGVNATLETAFQDFAGDFAVKIAPNLADITRWYREIRTS